jgi:hypothetical protein
VEQQEAAPERPAPRTRARTVGQMDLTSSVRRERERHQAQRAFSLIDLIRRQDAIPDEDRDFAYMHVSTLINHCPRKLFLMSQDQLRDSRRITGRDRIMWRIGRAVEKHLRDSLIAQLGKENVVGWWKCLCGNRDHIGRGVDLHCSDCGKAVDRYHELPFRNDEYGLMGRPDFMYLVGDVLYVVEFKSKAIRSFTEITSAEPQHILQLGCYERLVREGLDGLGLDFEVRPEGFVLYGAKDYPPPHIQPYKEFNINLEQQWLVSEVDRLFNIATAYKAAKANPRAGTPLPPRLAACSSPESSTASKCVACTSCFARRT